ncbi:hypothetical protein J2755_000596 [Methanohalophilus levihalophilus]|uniref:DUF2110 family protein n=1 Tax=Methanohalophilus levihalophilus TaxID=1431282 RepID=UPI001AE69CBE|nr:DUF2110 family protein [Methanohalophilus levihalophilus]MBP2029676.1 hypothetical protein [Methanohalophilus levihalophilus]
MEKDCIALFIYANPQQTLVAAKNLISDELKDLEANADTVISSSGWLEVHLEGEDAEFALNFLKSKYGSPTKKPEPEIVYNGYIKSVEGEELLIDIGKVMRMPVQNLKSLGTGNAKQIAARFGLIQHFPVKVRLSKDGKTLEFADETIDLLWKWKKSPMDRVIANSSTRSKIKSAIKKTGHGRDIFGVEKLGLLENVIVCKEGTDGPGIVAEIGPLLKSEMGVIRGTH